MPGRVKIMLVSLAASALVSGCADTAGELPGHARRVTVRSEPNAGQAIASDTARFRLESPGPDWKLLHAPEAAQLVADAVAAAVSTEAVTGVVLLRREAGADLEGAAKRLISRLALTDKQVERNEPVRRDADKARRVAVIGDSAGLALRYAALLIARPDRIYELLAWGPAGEVSRDAPAFEAFFHAVSLLDGKLGDPSTASAPSDRAGADGRVRDGVFASAAGGYRLAPQRGWRLLFGRPAERLWPGADVGLLALQSDASIALWSEPASAAPPAAARDAATPPPARALVQLGGEPVALESERSAGGRVSRLRHCGTDRCLSLVARQPAASPAIARTELQAALAGFAWLQGEQAAGLRAELERLPNRADEVGADYCLRGGVLRDFAHSIRWTSPGAEWRIYAGEQARARVPAATLYLEQRRLGLRGSLVIEQAAQLDAKTYHQRVVDRLRARFSFDESTTPGKLGGADALTSEGNAAIDGTPLRYRVWTALHDGHAYQTMVWGSPEAMTAATKQVKAVAAGFELRGDTHAAKLDTEAYRDNRLGFEMSLPPRWHFRDRTPNELKPIGTFVRWDSDGRWVGVVAVSLAGDGRDEAWSTAWLEQLLRDEIGPLARASVNAGTGSLAGRPARRASWVAPLQHIDAMLLTRRHVLFAVVAIDHDGSALSEVNRGFGLLE